MRLAARILLILIAIAVGGTFILSAWTKFENIQQFEYTMVEHIHMPWMLSALAARFFVGLEGGLGALMALQLFGKRKWVLKTALWLLVAFSVYLVFLWITVGNNVNCGCFGDAIWMNASTSLLKNAALLVGVGLLLTRYWDGLRFKGMNLIAFLLPIGAITTVYIIFPIPPQGADWLKQKDKYTLNLDQVYAPTNTKIPDIDLRQGKHIVAFLSAQCPHCQKAAYKMHVMKHSDATLPFYLIIGGQAELSDFWKKTEAKDLPYSRLEKYAFLRYTHGSFPMILWLNNDTVVASSTYLDLDQQEIEDWLKK